MTTFDILVADELLGAFTNDNPLLPVGLHVHGPVEGSSGHGQTRLRVTCAHAPDWTEGRLVDLTISGEYDEQGHCTQSRITAYSVCQPAGMRA